MLRQSGLYVYKFLLQGDTCLLSFRQIMCYKVYQHYTMAKTSRIGHVHCPKL